MPVIQHNGKEYHIIVHRKKVKNINFRISKNCELSVSAPLNCPDEYLQNAIKSREQWFREHIDKVQRARREREKLQGDSKDVFWFLGKSYRLDIVDDARNEVRIEADRIIILQHQKDNKYLTDLILKKWLLPEEHRILLEAFERIYPLCNDFVPQKPLVVVKSLKTKWGICYIRRNQINLSHHLIHYPIESIEHVILHELVHFKHANHGAEFYTLLGRLMPDWKERKAKLKNPEVAFCYLDMRGFTYRLF
ncbi:MAG: M48 family metallopeptidase [Candidatus Cloacimonetes bacterium]|nr:M48 family metallopeptidase [Candidatus Cloacimonadota bacterium]